MNTVSLVDFGLKFHRGLIIVYPYGTYIKQGQKKVIVKTKVFTQIIGKDLLLIEDKLGLGLIELGYPKKINLRQFKKMYHLHLITEEDREKWWPTYKELYAYPVIKKSIFRIPILLYYTTGPQVTIKPKNVYLKNIMIGMSGYYYKYMYPKKTKNLFDYYSDHFNSLEVNSTFYSLPHRSTITNLKEHNLVYSIKVHKYITHTKQLKNVKVFWKKFYNQFKPIYDKIACFLFQFSPRFYFNKNNLDKLEKLSTFLNKKHNYAFEFRNSGWFDNEKVTKLFKKHKWTLVIINVHNTNSWAGDLVNGFSPPLNKYEMTSDIVYIRMHGSRGQYWGDYEKKDFKNIFNFVKNKPIKTAFIYFNNTDKHASAMRNAMQLMGNFNTYNNSSTPSRA